MEIDEADLATYTEEFRALPLERQLQWLISDYLGEGLSDVNKPHPEGWWAEGLSDDDDLSGAVGFLIHTTGPSFKVTVELYEEEAHHAAEMPDTAQDQVQNQGQGEQGRS